MYSRTQNENGTYNTRCLFCFMTIASCVETEKELGGLETRHICPERALAELLELEKAIGSRPQQASSS
jgi:phosphoserine aminotransferase